MPLNLGANLHNADNFYADLLAAHEDLSKSESDALNARLILILANHIGDNDTLREALQAAATAGLTSAAE
ncbi:DUF2783 domain-containing protein [Thalassobius sp. MITS945101]|uniref:DUF2783 domain-containing protein n=1 Tax=Thalassobius sp. MITS945101 TaxID=3096994 RepID=UPI00399AF9FA